ncbi:TRAP transporter small permease [candidate division KSB1 bacterium]|nr:TRAP transporter small permease [candidate division KSB1 bacterium]RQW03094.1 MAG: TRAP transporter small permease [candidate division KSB1 bacterium]
MWTPIKKALDRFLETLVAASMAILTIDVSWQVITRFILKNPSSWTEELATNLMIWVGLLGAAVALNYKDHLGIDYFVGKLSEKKRLWTEMFAYLCITLFSFLVMFLGGLKLVAITFRFGQLSPAMKLPMGYVYLAVPVAGVFLAIYSTEFFVETFIKLRRIGDHSGAAVETK